MMKQLDSEEVKQEGVDSQSTMGFSPRRRGLFALFGKFALFGTTHQVQLLRADSSSFCCWNQLIFS
jgi:hypothetical protein